MKHLLTIIFSFIVICSFGQVSASLGSRDPHKRMESVKATGEANIVVDSLFIKISPAIQRDIDDLQKALQELNTPDYVKKQSAILNDKLMTIINTMIKGQADPETLEPGSLRYKPGEIALKYKKK